MLVGRLTTCSSVLPGDHSRPENLAERPVAREPVRRGALHRRLYPPAGHCTKRSEPATRRSSMPQCNVSRYSVSRSACILMSSHRSGPSRYQVPMNIQRADTGPQLPPLQRRHLMQQAATPSATSADHTLASPPSTGGTPQHEVGGSRTMMVQDVYFPAACKCWFQCCCMSLTFQLQAAAAASEGAPGSRGATVTTKRKRSVRKAARMAPIAFNAADEAGALPAIASFLSTSQLTCGTRGQL